MKKPKKKKRYYVIVFKPDSTAMNKTPYLSSSVYESKSEANRIGMISTNFNKVISFTL